MEPAKLLDGQVWEQTCNMGGTLIALSDPERNIITGKRDKSYGTVTLEFIATDKE